MNQIRLDERFSYIGDSRWRFVVKFGFGLRPSFCLMRESLIAITGTSLLLSTTSLIVPWVLVALWRKWNSSHFHCQGHIALTVISIPPHYISSKYPILWFVLSNILGLLDFLLPFFWCLTIAFPLAHLSVEVTGDIPLIRTSIHSPFQRCYWFPFHFSNSLWNALTYCPPIF